MLALLSVQGSRTRGEGGSGGEGLHSKIAESAAGGMGLDWDWLRVRRLSAREEGGSFAGWERDMGYGMRRHR